MRLRLEAKKLVNQMNFNTTAQLEAVLILTPSHSHPDTLIPTQLKAALTITQPDPNPGTTGGPTLTLTLFFTPSLWCNWRNHQRA